MFACFNGVWMYRFSAQFSIVREKWVGSMWPRLGFGAGYQMFHFEASCSAKGHLAAYLGLKLHHMQFPPVQIFYLFSVWACSLSLTSCPYHIFLISESIKPNRVWHNKMHCSNGSSLSHSYDDIILISKVKEDLCYVSCLQNMHYPSLRWWSALFVFILGMLQLASEHSPAFKWK